MICSLISVAINYQRNNKKIEIKQKKLEKGIEKKKSINEKRSSNR